MNTFNRSFNQFRILWSCSLPFNNLKGVLNHRSGVYSPRYFHTTYSVNNYLHQIHSPFQMSQPSIAHCYEEIMEDLTLLHLFHWINIPPHKNSHIWVFSNLDWYWRVFHLHCFSWQAGKDQGGFYHPAWSKEEWGNHQYGNPHHWPGRREGPGHGQTRIEACDVLSALHWCNSSELNMVVARRYSNTLYIPRVMSHSLYLDVGTFSGGVASVQFPLETLCLCWLLPFSELEVLLPCKVGEEWLETYPYLPKFLWDSSVKEHHLSNPISLSVPHWLLCISGRVHPDWGRIRPSSWQHPDRRRVRLSSCQHPDRRVRV